MNLNHSTKLRAAMEYLKIKNLYACATGNQFKWTPPAATNVKETIAIERDRLHDARVWQYVTGK